MQPLPCDHSRKWSDNFYMYDMDARFSLKWSLPTTHHGGMVYTQMWHMTHICIWVLVQSLSPCPCHNNVRIHDTPYATPAFLYTSGGSTFHFEEVYIPPHVMVTLFISSQYPASNLTLMAKVWGTGYYILILRCTNNVYTYNMDAQSTLRWFPTSPMSYWCSYHDIRIRCPAQ